MGNEYAHPRRKYIESRIIDQSRMLGSTNNKRRIRRTTRGIRGPGEKRNEGIKFEEQHFQKDILSFIMSFTN